MRHSTTHLALAFCTTMAVSSAPLSPNPLSSPALATPRMIPEGVAFDLRQNDRDRSTPQKRSIGGFAYHNLDKNELDKRGTDNPTQLNENEQMNSFGQSDFEAASDSESDYNVGSASDTEIQSRSIPEIRTGLAEPSPLEARADFDSVDNFDNNASTASTASADDESMPAMSENDSSSAAVADTFSTDSFPGAESPSTVSGGDVDNKGSVEGQDMSKLDARSIDIDSQFERHGGREFMDANSWKA